MNTHNFLVLKDLLWKDQLQYTTSLIKTYTMNVHDVHVSNCQTI